MKYSFTSIFIMLLIFIVSCSDDNPSSPSDNNNTGSGAVNYFPQKQGNWWISENYDINDSLQRQAGNDFRDSTFISGTKTIMGKLASELKTIVADTVADLNYYYGDSVTVYAHSDIVNPSFEIVSSKTSKLPIFMTERWVKIADAKQSTPWTIFDTTYSNAPFALDFLGKTYSGKINGKYKIIAEKKGTENILIDGKSYKATEFKISYTYDGAFVPDAYNEMALKITLNKSFFYADGAGLVKVVQTPQNITVGTFSFPSPGKMKKVIKMNIIK